MFQQAKQFQTNIEDDPYSKVCEIVFSPDSKYIVSGYTNGRIEVRELEFCKILKVYDHQVYIYCLAYSHDGSLLASGGVGSGKRLDSIIKLWDMNEMDKTTPKFELRGHENSILRLVFSLDSKILISGSCDKTLRIWKLKDQSLIKIIKQNDGLYGIAINRNAIGSLVLNGELKIWSTVNYKLLSKIQAHSTGAGLDISDEDSNLMISSGYDDYLVKLWNIVQPNKITLLRKFRITGELICIWFLKFSADFKLILTLRQQGGNLDVWNMSVGKLQQVINIIQPNLNYLASSKDNQLATRGIDSNIQLWKQQ